MKQYVLQATLKSPLVHTEETNSNIATIYREKVYLNNKIYEIPAVHGNSIRGLLRNIGAEHFLTSIEMEFNTVPTNLFHILFSGGALEKMKVFVDISEKKEFRKYLPYLSIFGAAVGDEMIEGKLIVTSAIPRCKELNTGESSIYDLTQIIRYTRHDDRKMVIGDKHLADHQNTPYQMFYDIETLCAGTVLDFEFILKCPSDLEQGAFENILKLFKEQPFIGGKSAVGHGRIEFDVELDQNKIDNYNIFLKNNKDDIKQYLKNRFKI